MQRRGSTFFALLCAPLFSAACEAREPPPPPQILATSTAKTDAGESDPPLLVYVASDGIVRLDGRELLDDSSILAHASAYEEAHARGMAIVRSAPAALHGRTIRIVELLEEAKIPSVAIDQMR
jgi:biopolymer transport protein ExbD